MSCRNILSSQSKEVKKLILKLFSSRNAIWWTSSNLPDNLHFTSTDLYQSITENKIFANKTRYTQVKKKVRISASVSYFPFCKTKWTTHLLVNSDHNKMRCSKKSKTIRDDITQPMGELWLQMNNMYFVNRQQSLPCNSNFNTM